jgi:hypothetical protein
MSRTAHAWAVGQGIKGARKAVLVVLADYANEANRAWPSIPLIGQTTGRSERAVQYALLELQAVGAIEIERSIGGRGHASHYILNLEWTCGTTPPPSAAAAHRNGAKIAPIRPVNGANSAPFEAVNGANTAPIQPETVQSLHPSDPPPAPLKGAILTLNGAKVAPDSKRNLRKEGSERGAGTPPPARTTIPEDWQPNAESERYAAERGVPLAPTVRKFRNNYRSNRKVFPDWQARFRLWCDEDEKRIAAQDNDPRGNGFVTISLREPWGNRRNGHDQDADAGAKVIEGIFGRA